MRQGFDRAGNSARQDSDREKHWGSVSRMGNTLHLVRHLCLLHRLTADHIGRKTATHGRFTCRSVDRSSLRRPFPFAFPGASMHPVFRAFLEKYNVQLADSRHDDKARRIPDRRQCRRQR